MGNIIYFLKDVRHVLKGKPNRGGTKQGVINVLPVSIKMKKVRDPARTVVTESILM